MSIVKASSEIDQTEAGDPVLVLDVDKVCFILTKARQFDAKVEATDPDSGSNATDDGNVDILEEVGTDPVEQELISFIHDLNVDEKIELVALTMLGRGDGNLSDWAALKTAAEDATNNYTAGYLMGIPLLSDYLEEGLSLFGVSCQNRDSVAL
jgi:hypothetical protein